MRFARDMCLRHDGVSHYITGWDMMRQWKGAVAGMSGYPDKKEAERILEEAERMNPGPWADHSRYVALCAEAVAAACPGMDPGKAYVLGLLHDVGRRAGRGQMKHVYHGWKYLNELGYPDAAKVCLTHSYNTQRFEDDMGARDIPPEREEELKAALAACVYDDYDRLIQLCDSFAAAEGVVDILVRMTDVKTRYGAYPQPKWDRNLELMEYFRAKTGKDLYSLAEQHIKCSGGALCSGAESSSGA